MEFLDIGPGPQVGRALDILLEAKLEGSLSSREEAFELLRDWAAEIEAASGEDAKQGR